MPFYDNYFARGDGISKFGMKIIVREVNNRIRLSQRLGKKNAFKTLELGPGKGYFAKSALKLGWEYLAIDGSPTVLHKLGEEGVEVVNAMVPPLPEVIGNGYELVLMEHFIEHMDSPASARILVDSIYKSLSQNGLICIVSPDFLVHKSNFWDCDYTHSFVTTIQRLSQLLMDCDFEVCYVGYETLGFENKFITWVISVLTNILYSIYLPQTFSLLAKGSVDSSNKWKNVLLRSCVVVGRKRSYFSHLNMG